MSSKRKKPARRRSGAGRALSPVDELAREALRHVDELLDVDDPLEAEMWASGLLGVFYKADAPLSARGQIERELAPALVRRAERRADATGLAVLCALGAVTGDEAGARAAADRVAARGVPRPAWAAEVGAPQCLESFSASDVYGDQRSYYLVFRYPGRRQHLLLALYDENLGGIIKDAFVAEIRDEGSPRSLLEADPDIRVHLVDPADAAADIFEAIATGDLFVDNDWTDEFREARALVLARARLLYPGDTDELLDAESEPALGDEARDELIREFLASPFAPQVEREVMLPILEHCLYARCDYGDGDPLRWSPVVVELFMLDFLPRKVSLTEAEEEALPRVLEAWVRFALTRRGLEQRFIEEAVGAVDEFTDEFWDLLGDEDRYGPAKSIAQALLADGVDVTDKRAVDAWMKEFNERPEDEKPGFFGPHGEGRTPE
jgi:hypothetical protein